jgi:hypothetical protein
MSCELSLSPLAASPGTTMASLCAAVGSSLFASIVLPTWTTHSAGAVQAGKVVADGHSHVQENVADVAVGLKKCGIQCSDVGRKSYMGHTVIQQSGVSRFPSPVIQWSYLCNSHYVIQWSLCHTMVIVLYNIHRNRVMQRPYNGHTIVIQ